MILVGYRDPAVVFQQKKVICSRNYTQTVSLPSVDNIPFCLVLILAVRDVVIQL